MSVALNFAGFRAKQNVHFQKKEDVLCVLSVLSKIVQDIIFTQPFIIIFKRDL